MRRVHWAAMGSFTLTLALFIGLAGCGGGASTGSTTGTPSSANAGSASVASATTEDAFPDHWHATNPLIDNSAALMANTTSGTPGVPVPIDGGEVQFLTPPYVVSQVLAAYSVSGLNLATIPTAVPNQGQGQTVAIIDAQGQGSAAQIQADLTAFAQSFAPSGYPAPRLFIQQMDAHAIPNPGFTVEISLDVEWVYAMAPQANILLVEGDTAGSPLSADPNKSDPAGEFDGPDTMAAVDFACNPAAVAAKFPALPAPSVVSMSFGGPEFGPPQFSPGITASDFHFNHPGVSCLASSGDAGDVTKPPTVLWPASSPFVTGVGGTGVTLNAAGVRQGAEVVWNELAISEGATGGGPSMFESQPSFQSGFARVSAVRNVPDVAMLADPTTGVFVVCSAAPFPADQFPNLHVVGGTSLACPLWAGTIALANAQRKAIGLSPLKSLNSDLYTVAGTAASYKANFIDITSGTNGDFSALVGYDLTTGLGVPIVSTLVESLTKNVEQPASGTVLETLSMPASSSSPSGITKGPDGNLWITENQGDKIARLTTAGVFKEFEGLTVAAGPSAITTGPDGNLWFTENKASKIGRISPTGTLHEFTIPSASSGPSGIVAGSDGNLWFTENNTNKIGHINPTSGAFIEATVPTANSGPSGITAGPDKNLWFTENKSDKIGRVTPTGVFTEFKVPTSGGAPLGITTGPDGNLWFTENGGNKIGRITTAGVFTEFLVPTSAAGVSEITVGSDGNLWFTESTANKIGQITTAGTIKDFPVTNVTTSAPFGIVNGPDGNLWFTEPAPNVIGRMFP